MPLLNLKHERENARSRLNVINLDLKNELVFKTHFLIMFSFMFLNVSKLKAISFSLYLLSTIKQNCSQNLYNPFVYSNNVWIVGS